MANKYEIILDMPEALQEKYRAEIKPLLEEMTKAETLEEANAFHLKITDVANRYLSGAEG